MYFSQKKKKEKKKVKTTFQIRTKTPTTKKFVVEPSFSQVGQ